MSKSITQKRCKVDGCSSPGFKKGSLEYFTTGFCPKHYHRYRKYKDTSEEKLQKIMNNKTKNKLYSTYRSMLHRCYYSKHASYPKYKSMGIVVCDRWLGKYGFDNFLKDMGERPDGKTLDRIDNNGNYEPSNCRWATIKEQANNKRSNTLYEINGVVRTISQWAEISGLNVNLLYYRNKIGVDVSDFLNPPSKGKNAIKFKKTK